MKIIEKSHTNLTKEFDTDARVLDLLARLQLDANLPLDGLRAEEDRLANDLIVLQHLLQLPLCRRLDLDRDVERTAEQERHTSDSPLPTRSSSWR